MTTARRHRSTPRSTASSPARGNTGMNSQSRTPRTHASIFSLSTRPDPNAPPVENVTPTDWKTIAEKAWQLYKTEAYVRNPVEFWLGLTMGEGIEITCQDEAVQELARAFSEDIDLDDIAEDIGRQLLVKGDAVPYCGVENATDPNTFFVQSLNPTAVQLTYVGGKITDAKQVISPNTTSDSSSFATDKTEPLVKESLMHLRWKSPQYEQRGTSMVLAAFRPIHRLNSEYLTEDVTNKRHREPLPILTVGGEFAKQLIEPSPEQVQEVMESLNQIPPGGGIALPYWAKLTYEGADKLVGSNAERIKGLIDEILVAMDMPRALVTGDGPNFATASVSLKKVLLIVSRIRKKILRFLRWVFKNWAAAHGITATIEFGIIEVNPDQDLDWTKILMAAYQLNLISRQTLLKEMGLSPEIEDEQMKIERAEGVPAPAPVTPKLQETASAKPAPRASGLSVADETWLVRAYTRAGLTVIPSVCGCGHTHAHGTCTGVHIHAGKMKKADAAREAVVRDNITLMDKALAKSAKRIDEEIARLSAQSKLKTWESNRLAELSSMRKQMDQIRQELKGDLTGTMTGAVDGDLLSGVEYGLSDLKTYKLPDLAGAKDAGAPSAVFSHIDQAAVEALKGARVNLAGSLADDLIDDIQISINSGVLEGRSIQEVAREIGSYVTDEEAFKNAGGTIYHSVRERSLVIARTETLRAHNEGALTSYKQFGVARVRRLKGPNACPLCDAADGTVYDIADAPSLPAHPQCVCTIVADFTASPEEAT